jgi:FHA domain
MDQSKKTMRHFYCRDVLWDTFEQMANDFDCSIDYLINEAMRYYARSKNYTAGAGGPAADHRPAAPPSAARSAAPTQRSAQQQPPQRGAPPPPPGMRRGPSDAGGSARQPAGPGSRSLRTPTAEPAAPTSVPTLYLVYNNERLPIDKDQFIIGRGAKTSDLPIKDGNISRKHAAVIRRNGVYYIKDLGSTNGIDYKGMRIDNKRIDEGDLFHLCDYELKFTFRG